MTEKPNNPERKDSSNLERELTRRRRFLAPLRNPPPPEVMAHPRTESLMAECDSFSVISGWGLSLVWSMLYAGQLEEAEAELLWCKRQWLKEQQQKARNDSDGLDLPPFDPEACTGRPNCRCEWCRAVNRIWARVTKSQRDSGAADDAA